MSIVDFASLSQAVTDNLARSDLAPFVPDFITMAENWLNFGADGIDPLRCREMETVVPLTPDPVTGISPLPADYLQYIRASVINTQRATLSYLTPDQAERWYPDGTGGIAEFFSIIGTGLYTYPITTSQQLSLVYYAALPPLTAGNPTNWLLTKSPSLYLRAALSQAAEFIKDDAEMTKQGGLAAALLAGLNRSDMLAKYARAGITFRNGAPS